MLEGDRAPRCKRCGNEMYMTRFQSDVSPDGIHRERLYECLWCGEDELVRFAEVGWGREAGSPENRVR
jgi:hypothetical protein